jgi:uncharacterized protein (TIGR03437 family)
MFFTAAVSGNTPWLTLSSNSGIASDNAVDLIVSANTTNLPFGTYNASITLTGPGRDPTLTVPVQLKVSGVNVENTVGLSPAKFEFTAVSGDTVPPQYAGIFSDLGSNDEFSISTLAEGGWLTVELLPSPRGFTKITVSAAAAPGSYTGSFKATSLRTGDSTTGTVSFKLDARSFTVTPQQLVFRQSERGATVSSQEVQVRSNRVSEFRIVSQPLWVAVQAPALLTTPATLVVSASPGALAPGQYEGALRLSGPAEVSIPISLTVAEPAPPTVTPSVIAFAHELGSPAPPAQSVAVSNPGGPLGFSAQASTASGIDWLTLAATAATTPADVVVRVNVARLTPGQHTGAITIRVESTPAKIVSVPVTVTVKGAAVQVRTVLNAATLQPTAVSPGLLLALGGFGLGPETPAIARPSPAGAYETQLAGVAVFFDGMASSLLQVSSERILALVPYGIYGRATVSIQVQNGQSYSIPIEVKTVDAALGVFTLGQDGRGQALALNADSTPNSVLNPAKPGSIVIVYLTGEGQTDPPGQDGRIINTDIRKPMLTITATIGGRPAELTYAGSAPMLVSGICQVNLRVPEGVTAGAQALEIRAGHAISQRGVTIEVQ